MTNITEIKNIEKTLKEIKGKEGILQGQILSIGKIIENIYWLHDMNDECVDFNACEYVKDILRGEQFKLMEKVLELQKKKSIQLEKQKKYEEQIWRDDQIRKEQSDG